MDQETVMKHLWGRSQQEGDCRLWVGSRNHAGYAVVSIGGSLYVAHRLTYLAQHPEYCGKLTNVCGSNHCINPAHWTGFDTSKKVAREERVSRIRKQKSAMQDLRKQKQDQAHRLYRIGVSQQGIAARLGVSQSLISKWVRPQHRPSQKLLRYSGPRVLDRTIPLGNCRVRDPNKGMPKSPHRVLYTQEVGPIPAGSVVLRTCGTPDCLNPTHLSLQIRSQTITKPRTHLQESERKQILELGAQGTHILQIAQMVGRSMGAVRTCLRSAGIAMPVTTKKTPYTKELDT